jgi:hypothetical protein
VTYATVVRVILVQKPEAMKQGDTPLTLKLTTFIPSSVRCSTIESRAKRYALVIFGTYLIRQINDALVFDFREL